MADPYYIGMYPCGNLWFRLVIPPHQALHIIHLYMIDVNNYTSGSTKLQNWSKEQTKPRSLITNMAFADITTLHIY
jgi:hypothetical protein